MAKGYLAFIVYRSDDHISSHFGSDISGAYYMGVTRYCVLSWVLTAVLCTCYPPLIVL